MGEALLRQKQQEFEVILIEMSNYLFSQSDSSISQRQEFGRSVGATYTPIILTATTQQLPQAQKLVATPKQELSEEYLPIQAVLEFPLDSLQIKNLWQYKVKCLLQNHGVIGSGVVKNKKCEVSGTSIQNVTTSGEGVDSEVTSIVRFTNGQGSGELDMSQYSEGQPSKQSSQPAIGAPQPAQSKQRKRRIESTDTGSPTKKPQLAYKVPFQLHPQPLLPSMPMGMFNNSWVPPPPAPGAVWGCPVPPGLCLGGHNLTAQALPPPLMIQHPFLGPAAALVVPSRKVTTNSQVTGQKVVQQPPAVAPAVMVPCSVNGLLQQQQQQQQFRQQQQVLQQQKQMDFLDTNLNKFLSRVESQQDLFRNEIEGGLDLDLPGDDFDSLFCNPEGIDAFQQLFECEGGDMEMNRNCSFTHLDQLA